MQVILPVHYLVYILHRGAMCGGVSIALHTTNTHNHISRQIKKLVYICRNYHNTYVCTVVHTVSQ